MLDRSGLLAVRTDGRRQQVTLAHPLYGEILRARSEAIRGYTAESQRRRSELAAAARRGGFEEGETFHIGWRMLDPSALDRGEVAASDPLALVDGVASIRWSAAGGFMPLERYLDERVGLLLDPPAGA